MLYNIISKNKKRDIYFSPRSMRTIGLDKIVMCAYASIAIKKP